MVMMSVEYLAHHACFANSTLRHRVDSCNETFQAKSSPLHPLSDSAEIRQYCTWEYSLCDVLFCYRATQCVSAVFAVTRCLSVRLSVTMVDCIHTAEDIMKLLVRSGISIILVFDPQRRYPITRGTSSAGAQIHGGGKICDFRTKSPFISETVRDKPMVAVMDAVMRCDVMSCHGYRHRSIRHLWFPINVR